MNFFIYFPFLKFMLAFSQLCYFSFKKQGIENLLKFSKTKNKIIFKITHGLQKQKRCKNFQNLNIELKSLKEQDNI